MASATDRSAFAVKDSIEYIWTALELPHDALQSVNLQGSGLGLPSSFKIGHLAHSSIALSALAAAQIHALRNKRAHVPKVTVQLDHAMIEFKSCNMYTIDGRSPSVDETAVGGFHKTKDGYVLIHDSFAHHAEAALRLLRLPLDARMDQVRDRVSKWEAEVLEAAGMKNGAVIAAVRTCAQWDAMAQASAVRDFPISIRKIAAGPPGVLRRLGPGQNKCLRGLRVLDTSHVIAGPVAGRTLAAHGADVLWVTSPNRPVIPAADRDCARGKRTAQLDLDEEDGRSRLQTLLEDAHVWVQSYRPGSLVSKGFSPQQVAARSKQGIVCVNMSSWGSDGPWKDARGFDSIVQTASGIFASEAEHYGDDVPFHYLSTQALDYGSGFLLATGIMAALYRQELEGGSYVVEVSLAGTMKYLRTLGQYPGRTGFDCSNPRWQGDVKRDEFFETKETQFGPLRAVKHSATIDGVDIGYEIMPKPLGSDRAEWLLPMRDKSTSRLS